MYRYVSHYVYAICELLIKRIFILIVIQIALVPRSSVHLWLHFQGHLDIRCDTNMTLKLTEKLMLKIYISV